MFKNNVNAGCKKRDLKDNLLNLSLGELEMHLGNEGSFQRKTRGENNSTYRERLIRSLKEKLNI